MYEKDLEKNTYLLTKFKKGYFGMAVAFSEPLFNQQNRRRVQRTNFIMKDYSREGIDFLKTEME